MLIESDLLNLCFDIETVEWLYLFAIFRIFLFVPFESIPLIGRLFQARPVEAPYGRELSYRRNMRIRAGIVVVSILLVTC